jgi:hypothetical protein
MKIFIDAVTNPDHVFGSVTMDTLPIDINWFFDDGVTSGGGEAINIPWSVNDTATTLNNAIKTAAINNIAQQQGYVVDLATDHLFVMCGFLSAS